MYSKSHNNICVFYCVLNIVKYFYSKSFHSRRHKRCRTAYAYICTKLCKSVNITSHNSAVVNIAYNRNFKTFKSAFFLLDCKHIQKCLRRVFIHTVTGIDYRCTYKRSDKMRCTAHIMSHYKNIGTHCIDCFGSVYKRFAFLYYIKILIGELSVRCF